ncbi:hypothetical protein D8674_028327 [Pyrus ussuriensis x Pyrus communis]|uniref:RNase H type-1 domain-containing protein n=1 Tax=Pyrus ussuriensis x Pyrus communis TaxID=2448454 RepID=A0A5N5I359_9ROSA|nr:hypothetical protein D8674_028327 [Pyrus ussuriensis x Pyrus communis]
MVFKKKLIHPIEAVELLRQQRWEYGEMEEWVEARFDEQRRPVTTPMAVAKSSWERLPFRIVKMNCDGACRKEKCGFGWVARNFAGIFRAAGGVGNNPCASSLMAEVDAVRAALVAFMEKGFFDAQVLGDF